MKKVVLVLVVLASAGCGYARAGAGEEVVLVRKPWFFGHGGIDPEPVRAGSKIIAWSTSESVVNMQPRTFIQHYTDMFTNDGVPLEFNVATRLQVTDSVRMAREFGVWEYQNENKELWPGWFGNNMMKPIENFVRQAVRKHGLNETAINPTAIDSIDAEVFAAINAEIMRINLPVKLLGFTVGKATPPDAVKNQRIATAEQQQRKLTEDQRKLAEDARLAAEESRAKADNAYRNQMGLNSEQFVQLENIHMQRDVCSKGGCTFIAQGVSALVGK
jgi:regulator of protease activity HflC (stomatin/prohibitin superfamily)